MSNNNNNTILVAVMVAITVVAFFYLFHHCGTSEQFHDSMNLPPRPPVRPCNPKYEDCKGMCNAVCLRENNFCLKHSKNPQQCQNSLDSCNHTCYLDWGLIK